MKIGIITLPLHTNYGGVLQAYALQTVLKKMGHEVVTVDKGWWELRCSPFRRTYWRYRVRSWHTRRFVAKYMDVVVPKDWNEIIALNLDALVVGSDQVWRPLYFNEDIRNAFLYFAKDCNVKRIAYAASFGTETWEYTSQQTASCAELIKLFNAVSVREESAGMLCRQHLQVKADVLPDPTMLLNVEDYSIFFQKKYKSVNENVLCTYFLDPDADKSELVEWVAGANGTFAVQELGVCTEDGSYPLLKRIQPPVESFLSGIAMASVVVTDSFHGCVFAILFHKPFIVYGNSFRGMARFCSLLKIFGLEERLVASSHEFIDKEIKPIDWDEVDSRLNVMRKSSFSFLHEGLNSVDVD